MPSRNILKDYLPQSYYHIYNRGVAKQDIFKNRQDYKVFLRYIKRHLCAEVIKNDVGTPYLKYVSVELLAFCLMPNHFHMLIYIREKPEEMTQFLRSVCTAYSMYFNKRYDRVGPLFQSRYKASRIDSDAYAYHISRYIHLNPRNYLAWEWSSLRFFLSNMQSDWIHPRRILDIMDNEDYAEHLAKFAELKSGPD